MKKNSKLQDFINAIDTEVLQPKLTKYELINRSLDSNELITDFFLELLGFDNPYRVYHKGEYRLIYRIEGYDCEIFISPTMNNIPNWIDELGEYQELSKSEYNKHFTIEVLKTCHNGGYGVFINNLDNHLTTLTHSKDLYNFLNIVKAYGYD